MSRVKRNLISYAVIAGPRGDILVLATAHGVSRIMLGGDETLVGSLRALPPELAVESRGHAAAAARQLKRYFKGGRARITTPLDWARGTAFQKRVWEATRRIPYGQAWSYKAVARAAGVAHAPRAVGQALAANPTPILVPCHRVVYGDGSLGGYTAGESWKEWLLALEDIQLKIRLR